MPDPGPRPRLEPSLPADEFRRWYWRKDELQSFARVLGIRAAGSKELLTRRIHATLAGVPLDEPVTPRKGGRQLKGPLTGETVIPSGQRCSQHVRSWFVQEVSPGFHFDAAMRAFFAAADGTQTLDDAARHWHDTRDRAPDEIAEQFEYNRFTRAWHAAHPEGTSDQLRASWREYRDQPVDERGRV